MRDDKTDDDNDLLIIELHCDRPFAEVKAEMIALLEKEYFTYILKKAGGVLTKASKISGTDRKRIRKILRKHKIVPIRTSKKVIPFNLQKRLKRGMQLYLRLDGKNPTRIDFLEHMDIIWK